MGNPEYIYICISPGLVSLGNSWSHELTSMSANKPPLGSLGSKVNQGWDPPRLGGKPPRLTSLMLGARADYINIDENYPIYIPLYHVK